LSEIHRKEYKLRGIKVDDTLHAIQSLHQRDTSSAIAVSPSVVASNAVINGGTQMLLS
jgi:hypothetical protein